MPNLWIPATDSTEGRVTLLVHLLHHIYCLPYPLSNDLKRLGPLLVLLLYTNYNFNEINLANG